MHAILFSWNLQFTYFFANRFLRCFLYPLNYDQWETHMLQKTDKKLKCSHYHTNLYFVTSSLISNIFSRLQTCVYFSQFPASFPLLTIESKTVNNKKEIIGFAGFGEMINRLNC